MPSMRLNTATAFCKVCMRSFRPRSLLVSSIRNPTVCSSCRRSFKPHIRRWKVDGVPCVSLYEYDEGLRSVIYQFKGCGDYELRSVLVENIIFWAKLRFSKYIVVPAPSWIRHDEERGFNHVQAIFEQFDLPLLSVLYKKEDRKQSDQSAEGRKEIYKYLGINSPELVKGKKILLVDDVYTTGSTIKSCIALLKKSGALSIAVIVIAKKMFKKRRN